MTDEFGREYALDLSLLLDANNVVIVETEEQSQAVIRAAVEQYPEKVSDAWLMYQHKHPRGKRYGMSFRGILGRLAWGEANYYEADPNVNAFAFEDILKVNTEIPESDFGLEYILGVEI